jgi:3-hydroxybutyryl-CoA dehydrogenase
MVAEIKTIAVIGAAEVGREFALAALVAGYRVILEDVSEKRLAEAVDWIARQNSDLGPRIVLAPTVEEAVREADLIFEAVADEMEMKIEMFTIFDKFAKPNAIFAGSSSSILVADLAAVTFCPERCIGMRLVPAAGQADVLELRCTPDTSDETIARCTSIAQRMGRGILASRGQDKTDSPQRTQSTQRRVGDAEPSVPRAISQD